MRLAAGPKPYVAVRDFGAKSAALRALLALGCVVSMLVAATLGQTEHLSQSDSDLAWLIRGVALIKACLVLAIVAVLACRFSRPLAPRICKAYTIGAWLMADSSYQGETQSTPSGLIVPGISSE